jgi:hypothetical protein
VKFAGALMIVTGLLAIVFTIRQPPGYTGTGMADTPFAGTSASGATTSSGYLSGGA